MKIAGAGKITETILALELAINERWNKGDVDGALEMYSEDVSYFDPLTETRLDGRKAVEGYFRQFFEGKLNILRNEFPNPHVIVSDGGDMAGRSRVLSGTQPRCTASSTASGVWCM